MKFFSSFQPTAGSRSDSDWQICAQNRLQRIFGRFTRKVRKHLLKRLVAALRRLKIDFACTRFALFQCVLMTNLLTEFKRLLPYIEQLEKQIQALDDESHADKELWHLARLVYVGQLVERSGLLYSLNEHAFCQFLTENKKALQKPTVK